MVKESTDSFTIAMYGNPWLDNGIENFYRTLKEIESCNVELNEDALVFSIMDRESFIEDLTRAIWNARENLIVIEPDKKTGEKKEFKKDFVIIQEEKKVGGKVSLKEDIFKKTNTKKILIDIFQSLSDEGEYTCILCGRKYKKSIKKLQQASFPMVTKIASLSGVRSYKNENQLSLREYYDNVCPLCYLIGILEWTDEVLVYRTFPGDYSLLFMPVFENLRDLHRFKRSALYAGILNRNERYSNIKVNPHTVEVENTPGEFSTLLCFYEKFVEFATDYILANKWAIMRIPFRAVKNIRIDYIEISSGILKTIQELKNKDVNRIYTDLIKSIFFHSQKKNATDWDITRDIHEEMSKYFLLDNFRAFTHIMLPRKGGYVFFLSQVRENLEKLICVWRWNKMGVPKERLEDIKSVGNIIAKVCENNLSLLYKMDKTRNLSEFWSVLREIARKLPGLKEEQLKMIRPTALDEVIQLTKEMVEKDKEAWKEIRDLLVIYASMYYSIGKMPNKNEGGGKE